MAYAIIRSGGKQYRVSPGQTITVEKLAAERGEKVTFADVVLLADGAKSLRVIRTYRGSEWLARSSTVQRQKSDRIQV